MNRADVRPPLTPHRVRELLWYNQDDGVFTWNPCRGWGHAGNAAGGINSNGYISICIDSRRYFAHRLAFLWMMGSWPPNEVDHVNGVRSDNRWSNLRLATHIENNRNRMIQQSNSTGFKGVHFFKRAQKYTASIMISGRSKHLGYFRSAEDAHAAYVEAARQHFGEYANSGTQSNDNQQLYKAAAA